MNLNTQKAVKIENLVPNEFCQFFTHVLLKEADKKLVYNDPQSPNAKAILSHHLIFDTLLEYLWDTIEKIVGEELLPTYSYARLYSNKDILKEHKDRPACEVSVTIQLGKSHDYAWSIFMGGIEMKLNEGDAVLYNGCDISHWRNECQGPEGYYSGQVFLHYVRKNGLYADQYGDVENCFNNNVPIFIKNRLQNIGVN